METLDQRLAYRVDQIPDVTGVPKHTLEQAIAAGELPLCRVNHKVRIVLRSDLEAWLRSHRCVPADAETIEGLKRRTTARTHGSGSLPPAMRAERDEARRAFDQLVKDP